METEKDSLYLAIIIGLDELMVAFCSNDLDGDLFSAKVLSEGAREIYRHDEEILDAVETSYKGAWSLLPKQFQSETKNLKVIFIIPFIWSKEGMVASEKLKILQKVLYRLQLKSQGFVFEINLVKSYLEEQEGGVLNLIVVSMGEKQITVCPITHGQINKAVLVERSDSIALDLEEGLAHFEKKSVFPPRILLLGGGDLEEIKLELLSFPWGESEKKQFFHLPRVEILSLEILLKGLMKEVKGLGKKNFLPPAFEKKEADFGFIKDEDIAQQNEEIFQKEETSSSVSEKSNLKSGMAKMQAIGFSLKQRLRFFLLLFKRKENHTFGFILIGGAVLLGAILAIWWYFSRAEIVLFVNAKPCHEESQLTVSPEVSQWNEEEKIMPAKKVETEVEGQDLIATSGTDTVGEKAVGQVVIYNRTGIEKVFETGTVLTGIDDLNFLTLEEVTVIAVNEDYVPGKKLVAVESEEIGPVYNLKSEQEFQVGSFAKSDFVAKNKESFAGGSSQEVNVVAEKDQTALFEKLKASLETQGEEKITAELVDGQNFITESATSEIVNEEFDHKVGDEAENLSLSLILKVNGLSYTDSDVEKLAETLLSKYTSSDYTLGEERETSFQFLEEDEKGMHFDFSLQTSLYPRLNEEEIKENLAGRKVEHREEYLMNLSHVKTYTAAIRPKLPPSFLFFPPRQKNIAIIIKKSQE